MSGNMFSVRTSSEKGSETQLAQRAVAATTTTQQFKFTGQSKNEIPQHNNSNSSKHEAASKGGKSK